MYFLFFYKVKNLIAKTFLFMRISPSVKDFNISTKLNDDTIISYKLKGYRHFRDYYNNAEIETWNFLASSIRSSGAVIDIGANIGQFSLVIAKIFESRQQMTPRIVCFEPIKSNFQLMFENFSSNQFHGELYNFAIGEFPEQKNLVVHEVYGRRKFKGLLRIESLDSLISSLNLESVQLVKIDTDGFELNILRGAKNFLNLYKPKVLIELNTKISREIGLDLSIIEMELNLLGYFKQRVFDNENALFVHGS